MQSGTPDFTATSTIFLSNESPDTSLIQSAPASRADFATSDLRVSIEVEKKSAEKPELRAECGLSLRKLQHIQPQAEYFPHQYL